MGPAVARVTYNGQQSAPFSFTVARNGPGLFTLNTRGSGPAVVTTPDYKVITYTNAAVAGDALSVWGTGIAPLTGRADNAGAEFFDPPVDVEVYVGGKRANVRYRGRAPSLAGVDQIVFDVPADVRGCNVPLAVRVAGAISNYSTLAVAGASRICSDPNGFGESDTSKAIQNGLSVGTIDLARSRAKTTTPAGGTVEARTDIALADFTKYDVDSFVRSKGLSGVSIGFCVVSTYGGSSAPADPFAAVKLNAGPQLTLTGPNGARPISREANGSYAATAASATVIPGSPGGSSTLYLDPGTYTVASPGGPDVGSFNTRITIPQPLTTNLDSIANVSRGGALNVTWSGGGGNEFVFISGFSSRTNPTVGATFTCTEKASAGRFQVPAEVLLAMPPSEVVQGAPLGSLSVISAPFNDATRFTASGLDLGFVIYTSADVKTLAYQ